MSIFERRRTGLDPKQEATRKKNQKQIIQALMNGYPNPVRMRDLEVKTGLTRDVLGKHLNELIEDGVVERTPEFWKLKPSLLHEERNVNARGMEIGIDIKVEIGDIGILFLRASGNQPFEIELSSGSKTLLSGTSSKENDKSYRYAETIPVDSNVRELTVKAKAMEKPFSLSEIQIAGFTGLLKDKLPSL